MPDTFTPDQFSQTRPILTSPATSPGLEAPASEAWIVRADYPVGRQLFLIKRNDTRPWRNQGDDAIKGWAIGDLEAVADSRNAEIGVTPLAAQALWLDYACGFLLPPTQPSDYAHFAHDRDARRDVISGARKLRRPASNGFLRILALTQGVPANDPISPRSIRHAWLMANYEVMDWAYWNGRRKPRSFLPTEQLADRVCKLACKLSALGAAYRPYSRNEASIAESCGDKERARLILAADQRARRRELKKLRARRSPVLRQLLAAIAAYRRARSSLCH